MHTRGFHHLALLVRDVERVAGFYREVLGLPEKQRHLYPDGRLRSIWLAVGEGFLAVEPAPANSANPEERPGFHLLALRIDAADRAAVERELKARGVAIEKASVWTLYFRDPEGNRVGLSHHPHDAPQ